MSQICRFRKSQTRAEGGTQERRPKTRLGSAAGCGPDERGWRLQAQRLTWNSTRWPAAAELSLSQRLVHMQVALPSRLKDINGPSDGSCDNAGMAARVSGQGQESHSTRHRVPGKFSWRLRRFRPS